MSVSLLQEAILGGCNGSYGSADMYGTTLAYCVGNEVMIYDLTTALCNTALVGHKDRVNSVRILNENRLLSGGTDKSLKLWESNTVIQHIPVSDTIIYIALDAERTTAVVLLGNGDMQIYSITQNLQLETEFKFGKNLMEACAVVNDEVPMIAIGGADSSIHIYIKQDTWQYATSLEGHLRTIRGLDFYKEDTELKLASCGQDGYIRVWKLYRQVPDDPLERHGHFNIPQLKSSFKIDAVLSGHSGPVSNVKWIHGKILSCSLDCTVRLWNLDPASGVYMSQVTFGQLSGSRNAFYGALINSEEDLILAHCYTGSFYRWHKDSQGSWKDADSITGHFNKVTDLVLSNGYVVTSSLDQTCRLWGCTSKGWKEISRPMIHGYDLNTLEACNNLLISGGDEKIIRVFEASKVTAELLKRECNINIQANKIAIGQALGLMSKSEERDVQLNDAITEDYLTAQTLWPELNKLYGHGYEISSLASAHKSAILASASKAQKPEHAGIFIWSLSRNCLLQRLSSHNLTVTQLSFSPDDNYLLSVSRDRKWSLFMKTEEEYSLTVSIQAHARVIYCCNWSIDSQHFITGSRDKRLKVWNTSGDCIKTLMQPQPITACAYITDAIAALGFENGLIRILNLETSEVLSDFLTGNQINRIRYDSGKLFTCSDDHTLRVFRLKF